MRAEETENGWATRSRASERGRVSVRESVCVRVCALRVGSKDTESLQAHINKRERARQSRAALTTGNSEE